MELGGLENVDEWIIVAAIFGFIAILLVLLVFAKGRGNRGYSEPRGWAGQDNSTPLTRVTCPTCQGVLKVKRDLPPMYQNAVGVNKYERCPTCKGKGFILQ